MLWAGPGPGAAESRPEGCSLWLPLHEVILAMDAVFATCCGAQQPGELSRGPLLITSPCKAAGESPASPVCFQPPAPALLISAMMSPLLQHSRQRQTVHRQV